MIFGRGRIVNKFFLDIPDFTVHRAALLRVHWLNQRLFNYIDNKAFVSVSLKWDSKRLQRHSLCLSEDPPSSFLSWGGNFVWIPEFLPIGPSVGFWEILNTKPNCTKFVPCWNGKQKKGNKFFLIQNPHTTPLRRFFHTFADGMGHKTARFSANCSADPT